MGDGNSAQAGIDKFLEQNMQKFNELPAPIHEAFAPNANPFGSGYVGPLLSFCDYAAWLSVHPERQKIAFEAMGEPSVDAVEFWASLGGTKTGELRKKMLAHMLGYQGGDNAKPIQQSQTVEVTDF